MSIQPNPKIRVRFLKAGKIRFVSHRDVARLVERALRKVRLPVAYSEGFSPRPKISFGLALSVSHESDAEYFDVSLTRAVDVDALAPQLTEALPDGLTVTAVRALESGSASLQETITSCTWRVEVLGQSVESVQKAVTEVLAHSELLRQRVRKGKTSEVDVRPAITEIVVEGPTADGVQLVVELSTEKVSLRPDELIVVLGEDYQLGRVHRTHQWMTVDGARCEPVKPASSSTRRELSSAS